MNLPKLPHQKVYFEGRPFATGMITRCLRLLAESHDHKEGYVVVDTDDATFYGMLRGGWVARAGQFTGGRPFELTPEIFTEIAEGAEGARFSLFGAEPALLDCLEVVLTQPPALQGAARYLPLADLDRTLRREGRDGLVTVGTSREMHLAVVRAGVPAKLYTCDPLAPVATGTILEQMDRFILRHEKSGTEDQVTLALYDRAVTHAPLVPGTAATEDKEGRFRVTVLLGERTIESRELTSPVTTVGRIVGNDVVIDNLGVSRHHCALVYTSDGLVLEDRGSLNGLVVNDRVVRRARLNVGDVVLVGKHKLVLGRAEAPAEAPKPPQAFEPTLALDSKMRPDLAPRRKSSRSAAKAAAEPAVAPVLRFARPSAVQMEARRKGPRLVSNSGDGYAVGAPGVTIGSDEGSDVKVGGFLLKRQLARIVKDGTGRYRILALSRVSRPRLNGETVSDEEILLDGDELRIGPERFTFETN